MATRRGAKETASEISTPTARVAQPNDPEYRSLPGTYAGAAAAGAANLVLLGYVIVAIREDTENEKKADAEVKKKS
ncbi:hypothetical protein FQN49_003695 [Arthroderma sp. PD_2]|nr:hypothetical protein FQN49_003695 [Arthroderma sp. PD_2]